MYKMMYKMDRFSAVLAHRSVKLMGFYCGSVGFYFLCSKRNAINIYFALDKISQKFWEITLDLSMPLSTTMYVIPKAAIFLGHERMR